MIQILGLRTYLDKSGIEQTMEAFFERGWRAESVQFLFSNIDKFISEIPEDERHNMFYTLSSCLEERGRKFESQSVIPIDIDDMDTTRIDEYIVVILRTLGLPREKVGIIASGNGLHFIIQLPFTFKSTVFFDENKGYYKAMCGRINQALYMHGLSGQADPVVFSKGRMLRLPNTDNVKNGARRKCFFINANIEPIDISLAKLADMPDVQDGDYIHPNAMKKLPKPDTDGVLNGCDYLKWCNENQKILSEPQWYAMLSVISRLEDGRTICHEYSKLHNDYDRTRTDAKITQALESAGPRTCSNISTLWEGCPTCENYDKCKSPIMIKSEGYIRTKDTGFYDVSYTANGAIKRVPDYDGLAKHFDDHHLHLSLEDTGVVYIFQDNYWQELPKHRIYEFAEQNFNPKPSHSMCVEFETKLRRTGLKNQDWFNPQGYVNFQNCILELETGNQLEHTPEMGFRYILPYEYDPEATCPRFTQFLSETMLNDEELISLLCEFMGYSLSGIDPVVGQKALILYGNGSNGKSVFLEVLKLLAGKGNYSTVSLGKDINNETNRYSMSGKLFNVTEETPRDAMVDSTIFKALVSGGEVQARQLYCNSFNMKNYAKIIMACNSLPTNYDDSNGMYRRLLIVPFRATFTERTRDPYLIGKLGEELSGIFNLAYMGYRKFKSSGGMFTHSKQVEKQVSEYRQESHPLSFFIDEVCTLDLNSFSETMTLYAKYKVFCDLAGMKPVDLRFFSRLMTSYLSAHYGVDMRDRLSNVRGFRGIASDVKEIY